MVSTNYGLALYEKSSTELFGNFIDVVFKNISTSSMNIIDTELYNNYKSGLHNSIATSYASNTYICNLPILTNYIFITFVPSANNTGIVSLSDTSVTPHVTKTLKKYNSSNEVVVLEGGELILGKLHLAYYNLFLDTFILYDLGQISNITIDSTVTSTGINPVTGASIYAFVSDSISNSGGGDMLKLTYDTDGDGKVNSAVNSDTVNGFTVGISVPANALFTDTIYTHPTTAGNKHIPADGAIGQFLKYSSSGIAVWAADNDTTYDIATITVDGLMSAPDKIKLDSLAQSDWDATVGGAVILNKPTIPTAYVHPITDGYKHIPSGGSANQILKWSASGTVIWSDNITSYTLPVASATLGGVLSGTDITIDASGNVTVNDDSHNHKISNIDELQTELNTKADGSQVLTDVPLGAIFTDTVYTHPTTSGNKHIPSGGSAGQFLKYNADGTAVWSDNSAGVTVNNTLTSTSTTEALSAAQGKALKDITNNMLALKTATITTTWTGSSAPYTQSITITGVTANDEPWIQPVYSTTNATAIAQQTAWNLIGKIVTGANKITVTCFGAKPTTAIPIQLKGY